MAFAYPSCRTEKSFQVKTLQLQLVQVEDGHVGVSEEGRPAVLEVLCGECETPVDFAETHDELRREVCLSLGAH